MDEGKELEELEREETSERLAGSALPPEMRARLISARENRKKYELEKNKRVPFTSNVSNVNADQDQLLGQEKQKPKTSREKRGGLTKLGRKMVIAGTALTLSGVGAEVGIPLREVGEVTQHSGQLIDKVRERKKTEQTKVQQQSAPVSINNLEEKNKKASAAAKRMAKRGKVTFRGAALMIAVAILFDLTRFGLDCIPVVGWILSPIVGLYGWLTFYVWTSMKGWGLSDTAKNYIFKKILIYVGLPITELIPIVNALPVCTAGVLLQIIFLKAEDALYYGTKGKVDAEEVASFGKMLESLFASAK
jgi:hypothetical protein